MRSLHACHFTTFDLVVVTRDMYTNNTSFDDGNSFDLDTVTPFNRTKAALQPAAQGNVVLCQGLQDANGDRQRPLERIAQGSSQAQSQDYQRWGNATSSTQSHSQEKIGQLRGRDWNSQGQDRKTQKGPRGSERHKTSQDRGTWEELGGKASVPMINSLRCRWQQYQR